MKGLAEVIHLLQQGNRFLVTTHMHPDGDGIGSMLALGRALRASGKRVCMTLTDVLPTAFAFLTGADLVRREIPADFTPEFLVALDCGDRDRMALPAMAETPPIINIDHHLSNNNYGLVNLVKPDAAATGEIVHEILIKGGFRVDAAIAAALYVAVATDTGFFRFTNTTGDTLALAARLTKEYRLNPGKLAETVSEQKSLNAIKLLGEVLATLRTSEDGAVAWMYLNQAMLDRYPVESEETEGFVNYGRNIADVEIALFFKEVRPGEIRVSWRSSSTVDVNRLAAHFGGGGHARAAGCTIKGELQPAMDEILSFIAKWRRERPA